MWNTIVTCRLSCGGFQATGLVKDVNGIHSLTFSSADNPSVSSNNDSVIYQFLGKTVLLVVHVSGSPIPQAADIRWYRNGTIITDQDPKLMLSNDHTQLTIKHIGTEYYGIYQCNVTTSAGTQAYNFTLIQPSESVVY